MAMSASLYDSSLPKVNPKNPGVIPHMTSSRLFAVSFCRGSICWLVLTLRLLFRGLRGAEDNGMSVLRTRVAKPSVVVDSKLDQCPTLVEQLSNFPLAEEFGVQSLHCSSAFSLTAAFTVCATCLWQATRGIAEESVLRPFSASGGTCNTARSWSLLYLSTGDRNTRRSDRGWTGRVGNTSNMSCG